MSAERFTWTGRVDSDESGDTRRWHDVVVSLEPGQASRLLRESIGLVGFGVDEGVRRNQGRVGAAEGPNAIRSALANFAFHAQRPIADLGTVTLGGGSLESAQREYARRVTRIIGAGGLPVGLGGGHEIAWGTWMGVHAGLDPRSSVLVLNLDAHLDLRESSVATSGTPFRQILDACTRDGRVVHYHAVGINRYANTRALIDRAIQHGCTMTFDESLQSESGLESELRRLDQICSRHDAVYLTICLDVLPSATAPGVSAPSSMGVPQGSVERIIDAVLASGRTCAVDIAEMNPRFDPDGRTARAAARLVARVAERAHRPAAPCLRDSGVPFRRDV